MMMKKPNPSSSKEEEKSGSFSRLIALLYGDVSWEEMPRIMWLSALLCAIIGGFWLLDSLKDTVLATTVGLEYQPRAKLLSVCVTLVVVSAYNALIDRISKPSLFYVVGSFYSACFVILGGCLAHKTVGMENTTPDPSRIVGWVAYFAIESYGSLAVALFWAFTNASIELEDAKSSYGLIVAFAQVGAIFGSTLATQARSLHISFLFVLGGASCLVVCAMVRGYELLFGDHVSPYHTGGAGAGGNASSSRRRTEEERRCFADDDDDDDDVCDDDVCDDGDDDEETKTKESETNIGILRSSSARRRTMKTPTLKSATKKSSHGFGLERRLFDGFELVLRHSYVAYLLAISTLYEVVLTVLDFEMKIIGRARYGADTRGAEEFAALMGHFGQTVNSVSFVFSLAGFSYVVRSLGLSSTLLVFPTLLIIATLIAYAYPSLWALFVTTAVLKALTYALNEPALEMLYVPTSEAIKFKAKAWIDVVGARSAKAAGSFINDAVQRSTYLRDNLPQYGMVPALVISIVLLGVSVQVGSRFEVLVDEGNIVGLDDDDDDDDETNRRRLGDDKDDKGFYEMVRPYASRSEDFDDDKKIFGTIARDDGSR